MHVLSFDVATKSLATSLIYYNTSYIDDILHIINIYRDKKIFLIENDKNIIELLKLFLSTIDNIISIIKNKIKINFIEVKDLIPEKKIKETDIIERSYKLHQYLSYIDIKINKLNDNLNEKLNILIEYQMGPNDKSRTISSQIIFHFTKYNNAEIYLIGPSLKNQIYVGNDMDGMYNNFIEKYKTNYSANKAHSRFNFLRIIDNFNQRNIIKNINKSNYDDIGDSVLMSIAWVYKNFDNF